MMQILSALLLATPVAVAPANGVDSATGPEGIYHLFKGNAPALYELSGPGTVKVHVRRAQPSQRPPISQGTSTLPLWFGSLWVRAHPEF